MTRVDAALRTDVGRVRKNNEDAVGESRELGAFVLADGMGGYRAGEVASQIAVSGVLDHLGAHRSTLIGRNPERDTVMALMREAVEHANRSIYGAARQNAQQEGMGTTVVATVVLPKRAIIANVGDSRFYLLRNGQLRQITKDHSLVQEMVDLGQYTREQAQRIMSKSIVTRALGVETEVRVDLFDLPLEEGDLMLLCSDGLSDMIDDDTLRALLDGAPDLERAAQSLVDEANARGGRDNIAVILARAANGGGLWSRLFGS